LIYYVSNDFWKVSPACNYWSCYHVQVKGMVTDFGESMHCQFLEILRILLDSSTLSGPQVSFSVFSWTCYLKPWLIIYWLQFHFWILVVLHFLYFIMAAFSFELFHVFMTYNLYWTFCWHYSLSILDVAVSHLEFWFG